MTDFRVSFFDLREKHAMISILCFIGNFIFKHEKKNVGFIEKGFMFVKK